MPSLSARQGCALSGHSRGAADPGHVGTWLGHRQQLREMLWWEMGTLLLGTFFLSPSDGTGNLSVRVAADPPKGRMGSILV